MKTKISLLLAAALVLGTTGAALGKNKPAKPQGFQGELKALGITCPQATVSLRGSFGGAGKGFMAVAVSKATGKASALVGKQVSLRLLKSTKIRKNGPTIASRLKMGERLDVVALMCSQGLVAREVTAAAKKS